MRLTTDELAVATGGVRLGELAVVNGASIDSRRIGPGELFVPIIDDRDGHDFIAAAVAAGASAHLTSRVDHDGSPAVRVADTSSALLALGGLARGRIDGQVVGVTGSVGKTSTKDLLASVLATRFATRANEASFNNELGVPLTLLGAPEGTEVIVCEMGARGPGHIALLCGVAHPTVGVVTAVEGAHLEQFGTLAAVAQAKGELVEALPDSGFAILNADQPLVAGMAARTTASVITFGTASPTADVRAEDVEIDGSLHPRFTLLTPWGRTTVALAVRGRHQVGNALAAASVGLALGVDLDEVAQGLAQGSLSPMRMDLQRRADGLIVLNDSYNANPTSMRAALQALGALDAKRHIAVLGFMAELGPTAPTAHELVAAEASALGFEVIAVGTELYGADVNVVADVDGAVAHLADHNLGEGDAVLVKGSRVAGLERLADQLLETQVGSDGERLANGGPTRHP